MNPFQIPTHFLDFSLSFSLGCIYFGLKHWIYIDIFKKAKKMLLKILHSLNLIYINRNNIFAVIYPFVAEVKSRCTISYPTSVIKALIQVNL